MTTPLSSFARFSAVAAFCGWLAPAALADTVLELKFDQTEAVIGEEEVTADTARKNANANLKLLQLSQILPEKTGLNEGWADFLGSGYLVTGQGAGPSSKNAHGIVTALSPADGPAAYRAYMGFRGLGSDRNGGTLYMVVSPVDWKEGTFGLFGTGHAGTGAVTLRVSDGRLILDVGGRATQRSVVSIADVEWDAEKWYFIGASWSEGSEATLYLREMSPKGPGASPEAKVATGAKTATSDATPSYDPIVIGSIWYNPGADELARDAANARIAYVRLENDDSSENRMGQAFEKLGK